MRDRADGWAGAVADPTKAVALITSVFGLIGSVAGAFVAIAGDSLALVRERGEWLFAAFLLLGIGLSVLVLRLWRGPFGDLEIGRMTVFRRELMVPVAISVTVIALVIALVAAVTLPSRERRPNIDASVEVAETGAQRLTGSISSNGLRADDTVHVVVVGTRPKELQEGEASSVDDRDTVVLSSVAVGAGTDGSVTLPLSVALDPSFLEARVLSWIAGGELPPDGQSPCWIVVEQHEGGCAEYTLADSDDLLYRRPTLTATLEGTGPSTVLVATVAADRLGADDNLFVRVYEPGAGGDSVFEAAFPPEADGTVSRDVRVPIGTLEQACIVVARMQFFFDGQRPPADDSHASVGRGVRCADEGSAWAVIRVPAQTPAPTAIPGEVSPDD